MGRRNLPCSTVNAQTEKSTGARFSSSRRASSRVSESLPPERATATRSPSRIILNRATPSPTLRSSVFSRSKFQCGIGGRGRALLAIHREGQQHVATHAEELAVAGIDEQHAVGDGRSG